MISGVVQKGILSQVDSASFSRTIAAMITARCMLKSPE